MNYFVVFTDDNEIVNNLIPILKRPMIKYALDAGLNFDKIIVVGKCEEELINSINPKALLVKYLKNDCIVGDGYSVFLPGNIPLINDIIVDNFVKKHLTEGLDLSILNCNNDNSKIFCVNNSFLREINTGYKDCLEDFVEDLKAKKGKIGYLEDDKSCLLYEVNDLFKLSIVEKYLRDSINKRHMLNGVNIVNPETVIISPEVRIGIGTIIYPGTALYGKSIVGNNCVIGPYTELNNSIIENNVSCIFSLVNDSLICNGARVGPYSHLRMNTIIGENDRIGNFVEVKKSILGNKTNVAHLSYIGDTNCGSFVNWGCGSITVNYDGNNKYKTNVGDRAFIGCNSNLIAPINISNDAYIAAGSTITENLDEGDFGIARARQITKNNYAKKYRSKQDKN